MAGEAPKTPWDQRLTERMAQQSWEAANDPARARRNRPLRKQVRSPYFWVAMGTIVAAFSVLRVSEEGWAFGLAGALYLAGLVASARANRG
jgi:hypothetical protein